MTKWQWLKSWGYILIGVLMVVGFIESLFVGARPYYLLGVAYFLSVGVSNLKKIKVGG